MRKSFFTMILLALASFVSAQSLQFEYNGQVYENGERIICTNVLEWGELQQDMQLHNLTNDNLEVLVEKEEVQIVEGTQNYFCWGSCYTPAVYVSPRPVLLAAGEVSGEGSLSFHHQIDPEMSGDPNNFIPGTSVVKYYAYPSGEQENKISIEVWFTYNAESVPEMPVANMGHAYPNPVSSMVHFDYNLMSTDKASVSIYNLLGQEVMTQEINALQGSVALSVADLQEGIYFCTMMVNGCAYATEKFVVKK